MAAIYSTVGLARSLAARLGDTGIGEWLFLLCCLLILTMVVTQGLRWRPKGFEIGIALGVVAVYALVFVRMAIPTERSHLIEYGVVALLVRAALGERSRTLTIRAPNCLAVAGATLLGALDECAQLLVPQRVFDPADMLFNFLGAAMALSGRAALAWARRRARRAGRSPGQGSGQIPSGGSCKSKSSG